MRHRIKKIPTLISNHLLHSNKSTYFYNSSIGNKFSHYMAPICVSNALLLVLGLMLFPGVNQESYALDNNDATPSAQANGMSVKLQLDDPDVDTLTTQAETGVVNYISKGFSVTTENVDGYNVYVQTAPGSSNKLKNGSIEIDFVKTDTPTSNFEDNTWGYAVDSNGQTPANLTYNPVPDASATNLNPAYSSTSTGETRKFTLNFAAKFAKDATAGHYGTDVLLSVAAGAGQVANLYSLEYVSNGGSNIPMNESISTDSTTHNFTVPLDVIPMREGYSFRGWSTNPDVTEGTSSYEPGKTFTVASTNPNTKLYAIWKKVINELASSGTMQNVSYRCSRSTTPSKWDTISGVPTAQLIDNRDNKTYKVAKLADGKCWMTQNLAFDLKGKTLTTNDSDVSADWVEGAAVNSSLWTGSSSDANAILWHHPDSSDTYGNQYTWNAATAGTGKNVTTPYTNATGSICPKGWRLPYGKTQTTVSEFENLLRNSYGLSKFNVSPSEETVSKVLGAPFFFTPGGKIYSGKLNSVGVSGSFWSATTMSYANSIDTLDVSIYSTDLGIGTVRYQGFSIRCVAK